MVKRFSDSTLEGMTKKQLIRYIRTCEHNQEVAEERLARQYENVKDLLPVVHAHWITEKGREFRKTCSNCNNLYLGWFPPKYCLHCGAIMDEEVIK